MGAAAQQRIDVSKLVLPVGPESRKTITMRDATWRWLDQVIANTLKSSGRKLSYGEALEYVIGLAKESDEAKK